MLKKRPGHLEQLDTVSASSGLAASVPVCPAEMNLPALVHIPLAVGCYFLKGWTPEVFAEKSQRLLGMGAWIREEPSGEGEGWGRVGVHRGFPSHVRKSQVSIRLT